MLIERLRKHLPDRRTVGQEQAPRVGIKNCVPALESALVQRGVAEPPAADPRHVIEDVETTGEEGQDLHEKPLDLSWIRCIGGQRQSTLPADFLKDRSGFRGCLPRAAADRDQRAFREETSRGRQADPAGPSHDQAGAAMESPGLSHGKEPRGGVVLAELRAAMNQSLIWKMASISTAMPPGKAPMPTALRVPMPASPKTSFMRSEKPLITLGWSPKSGVQLTIPRLLINRTT